MLTLFRDEVIIGSVLSLFSQRTEGWRPELERKFLEQVLVQRHTGLLASCTPLQPTNEELFQTLCQAGIRVIHIEPYGTRLPSEGYFMPDYRRAGYAAAVDLMLSGHKNLVLAMVKRPPPFALLLKEGFIDAINDHKRDVLVIDQEKLTKQKLKRLLRDGGCGLFTCSYQGGQNLNTVLKGLDSKGGKDARVLTVEMIGDIINPEARVDYITFARLKHMREAIAMVLEENLQTPKVLIPPEIVKF